MAVRSSRDLRGGVSLKSKDSLPPGTAGKNGEYSQTQRALALGSYFLSGAMAINASQFFGAPLYLVNKDWYNAWIAFTKQSFGLLTMTMTQWWAPTVVKVSGDKSMRGQLMKTSSGDLLCNFPARLILIANHQIYTDWLYLWWIAYANGMHGRLYIVLKESLKRIPVIGWGMQLSQFIFMKRNWEKDKPNMQKHLSKLNNSTEPMWLMLFPEGTNLAPSTREKSRAWARKSGVKDMQHQLLPRSTGLQFCLQELQRSVGYVYDCTIAYEGVKRGEYAQDVYTLKSSYLEGRPPKAVHIYWRRFAISSIPLKDQAVFDRWLQARWREKDYLLEMWHRTGQFPADSGAEKLSNGSIRRGCGHIETPVRPAQWYEFLQIFAPMGVLALVLSVFYGALPKSFMKSINKQAMLADPADVPKVEINGAAPPISFASLFTSEGQSDIFRNVTASLHKLTGVPEQKVLEAPPNSLSQLQKKPKNFLTDLEDEETSRKRHKKTSAAKPSKAPRGSFWDELKTEEATRRGSVVTTSSKAPSSFAPKKTTFWDDLKKEENARMGSVVTISSQAPSTVSTKEGTFWDDVKAEKNARQGSVISAPSKPTPSVAASTVSRPKASPRALSTSAVSVRPPASVSSTTSKTKAPTKTGPKAASVVSTPSTKAIAPKNTPAAKVPSAEPPPAAAVAKPTPKKISTSPATAKTTPSAIKKPLTSSHLKTVPSLAASGAASGTKKPVAKPAPPKLSPAVASSGVKKPAPPKLSPAVASSGVKKPTAKAAPPKLSTQGPVKKAAATPMKAKAPVAPAAQAQKPTVKKAVKT